MRIGIDMGGTKIEAAAVDARGDIRVRYRVPTPSEYGGVLRSIAGLVASVEAEVGEVNVVGIGAPGNIDPFTGLMHGAENTAVEGHPFADDLRDVLAREVHLANDAHCFALSEALGGAGADAHVVFGVVLGTGAGAGLVVGGQLIAGRHGFAGEWAHNPLPWRSSDELPGPLCYCGKHGCIETYLSGTALHRHAGGTPPRELARLAAAGEPRAAGLLELFADRLARALAAAINLIDPDVIVLGGGISNITALYALVPERWREYTAASRVSTALVPARFGDASGVRGAAYLAQVPEVTRERRAPFDRPRGSAV